MFYEFAHRHTPCTVDGIADKVILSRERASSSVINMEYKFIGRFSPVSLVQTGSLVVAEDSFFVQSKRKTPDNDLYCNLIKTNAQVTVQRLQVTVDNNGRRSSSTWNAIAEAPIPMNIQHRSGNTPYKDGLLLAETEFVTILQATVAVLLNDRFLIDSKPYRVNDINLSIIPGLQVVQLSVDTRQ